MKIRALIGALAKEAETGSHETRKVSRHNLEQGARWKRLVLAALTADLTYEHRQLTLFGDLDNPPVEEVENRVLQLDTRLDLWFKQGVIMSNVPKGTYTAQMLEFLAEPRIVYFEKYAHILAKPATKEGYFEPLERVRAIAETLRESLRVQYPPTSLVRLMGYFRLPACGETHVDFRSREKMAQLRQILEKTGVPEIHRRDVARELICLWPYAEASRKAGATSRHAWARASLQCPKERLARIAVDLFLNCRHSTGNTERWLKELARQTDDKPSVLPDTLNDLMQVQALYQFY